MTNLSSTKGLLQKHRGPCRLHTPRDTHGASWCPLLLGFKEGLRFHAEKERKRGKPQGTSVAPPGGEICQDRSQAGVRPRPAPSLTPGRESIVLPAARTGFQGAPSACLAPRGLGEARGGCSESSRTMGLSSFRRHGAADGNPGLLEELDRTVAAPGWARGGQPCHWLWA